MLPATGSALVRTSAIRLRIARTFTPSAICSSTSAIVDDLGDLADDAAIGDHRVAAPDRLQHLLAPLRLLALRAQDEEIHDDEDEDERQQHLHDVADSAGRQALRIGRSDPHGACYFLMSVADSP